MQDPPRHPAGVDIPQKEEGMISPGGTSEVEVPEFLRLSSRIEVFPDNQAALEVNFK